MPNKPILFSLKESQWLTREQWQQFTAAVRANHHSTAAVLRAFVLHYTAHGLGSAATHYQAGEAQPPPRQRE